VLQAIATDFPTLRWFAVTSGGEPRRAIFVSFLLSQATIFFGKVNAIAPVVSNFMLVMFVVLNLACAVLELMQVPHTMRLGMSAPFVGRSNGVRQYFPEQSSAETPSAP
jgi:hypothetical protein